MTTPTATKTKLVRVHRREFYDACGNIVYFLRVPEGMTEDEIERSYCCLSGTAKGEIYKDPDSGITFTCVGRLDDSNEEVMRSIEPTGGVELVGILEISEEELQEELS